MSSPPQASAVTPSLSVSAPVAAFSSPTTPSPASPFSRSPSPSSDNSDGGMPPISRSSSLLFGFLITFLALFVGFMACGYSSRRARQLGRGGAGVDAHFDDPSHHRPAKMKKPQLWDIWIAERPGKGEWSDMTPLSASLLRPKAEKKRSLPSSDDVSAAPTALREPEPRQEFFPSFLAGSRRFGRLSSSPPPPPPMRRSQRSAARLASELTVASFVLPPSDFTLPHLPRISTRTRNRHRNENPEVPTNSAPANVGDLKSKDMQAQISVLIAMPGPASRSSSGLKKSKTKSIGDDEDEIVQCQEDRPQCSYEIGVARVRMPLTSSVPNSSGVERPE